MSAILAISGILNGHIVSLRSLSGSMTSTGNLIGTIVAPTTIPFPTYEGSYVIEPKTISQTLDTTTKSLYEDLKVTSIPYYEVSNEQGGSTIIIGGNG